MPVGAGASGQQRALPGREPCSRLPTDDTRRGPRPGFSAAFDSVLAHRGSCWVPGSLLGLAVRLLRQMALGETPRCARNHAAADGCSPRQPLASPSSSSFSRCQPHTASAQGKQDPKTHVSQLLCYQREILHGSDITSPEQREVRQGLRVMKLYFLKCWNKKQNVFLQASSR